MDYDGYYTDKILNMKRGTGSYLVLLLENMITGGPSLDLSSCKPKVKISTFDSTVRYKPLAENLDRLVDNIDRLFFTNEMIRRFSKEYNERVETGECPLIVLNDILERLLHSRIEDESDKEYASYLISKDFDELRNVIISGNVDTVIAYHHLGFRDRVISYGVACPKCGYLQFIEMTENLSKILLPSLISNEVSEAIFFEDEADDGYNTLMLNNILELDLIYNVDEEIKNRRISLLIGVNQAGLIEEETLYGLLYIGNLYLHNNPEEAKRRARKQLERIYSHPGVVIPARYGKQLNPIIIINEPDINVEDFDNLPIITNITSGVRKIRYLYPNLSKRKNTSIHTGLTVQSADGEGDITIGHTIMKPEPLPEDAIIYIKQVAELLEEDDDIVGEIWEKRRIITRTVNSKTLPEIVRDVSFNIIKQLVSDS